MTTTQHILFGLMTLATMGLAPALTLPAVGAWGLMAWLGSVTDNTDVSSAGGCGLAMLLILFVGVAALALVAVGGAAMEGRL